MKTAAVRLNQEAQIFWTGKNELTPVVFVAYGTEMEDGAIQIKLQGSDKLIWVRSQHLRN